MADDLEIDALIDRGLAAIDDQELEKASHVLEQAQKLAGPDHTRVLHLEGLLAWASDDLEAAADCFRRAVAKDPSRPEIHLDFAECLFSVEEIEEAEIQVKTVLALEGVSPEQADEARLLLAQLRLADEDPDEAFEALEQVAEERKAHPSFLSTRGAVLAAEGRFEEALHDLDRALEFEPHDPDLHYQRGIALEQLGRIEESREAMVRTLELDREDWEDLGEEEEPDADEADELRSRLEETMEELPDPILKLVASAPITVQGRATAQQVREGVNPRSIIAFLGTPQNDGQPGVLKGIAIMRDLLWTEVEDDDEVDGELLYALVEEIQFFFQRPDFVLGEN